KKQLFLINFNITLFITKTTLNMKRELSKNQKPEESFAFSNQKRSSFNHVYQASINSFDEDYFFEVEDF
ncbi:MAG TPA: hypothetical protein VIO15_12560, partial [Bacteroidales bacterium]